MMTYTSININDLNTVSTCSVNRKTMRENVIKEIGVVTYGDFPCNGVLAITGLPRSGTTAAAEIVSTIIPLVFDTPGNLEHYKLSSLIEKHDIDSASKCSEQIHEQIYEQNNKSWSFKRPFIYKHSDVLYKILGDKLCWLVVTRDPLATAIREAKSNNERSLDFWLKITIQHINELMQWINFDSHKIAIVSYEKMLTNRGNVRSEIGKWLKGNDY